ncbi:MAG TPA: DUF4097 family beta strand repeat-containing protein [Candidatus Acidoferrales bacterium]|jgi:DUF4097 and DUF4098 domain-containing protein YvlB|nr:DUF4097 family beta strand repeat-containing protein [Candidatus Acidoferrales bacterium]
MLRRWMGILILICAAGLLAGPARAEEWSKKYAVSGKPELRVESNDAHIDVDTWDRKEIEARVVTRGLSIGSSGVLITESQSGDRVSVNVRVPRWDWHFGSNNRSVQITVMTPRETNLTAETGDGHVSVKSIAGKVDVHTGDGHITVASLRGAMRLRTGDGHVEGDNLDGKLDVQTGDGRVRVSGRFDELSLRTNDGSVDANARPGSKIETEWYVTTGDGAVRLRIPENLSADLDAHTGDGRITVDFPVTMGAGTMSRSNVRGKLNGGGPPLRVRTGDGSIHIGRF